MFELQLALKASSQGQLGIIFQSARGIISFLPVPPLFEEKRLFSCILHYFVRGWVFFSLSLSSGARWLLHKQDFLVGAKSDLLPAEMQKSIARTCELGAPMAFVIFQGHTVVISSASNELKTS